jgi:protein tyrosine phosphatase (PTP) superfamily phosphohydrolase (DUF442 family)
MVQTTLPIRRTDRPPAARVLSGLAVAGLLAGCLQGRTDPAGSVARPPTPAGIPTHTSSREGTRNAPNPMPAASSRPSPPTNPKAESIPLPGIENARRIGPNLWSGGEPSGDPAFAALAAQGVRVVVSVDGARPDVEAARRHGLRYVHVPIGYDGVPRGAVESLAGLARLGEGGVFVHCHHGRHRGPTAAAIVAMAAGAWDPATANAWQREAGTSPEYEGLYRAVREFSMPSPRVVRAAARRLVSVQTPKGLVAAMVTADHQAQVLDALHRHGWKPLDDRPDETAVPSARLLREQFTESIRLGHGPGDDRFREAMRRFEAGLAVMEDALRAGESAKASDAWKALRNDCRACHQAWRDRR